MNNKTKRLMYYLEESILHLDVSGFELLEILDIRSQLASREPVMDEDEKVRLERFDQQLSQVADQCATRISEVADLAKMRKRANVLPSHWWWYIDERNLGSQKRAVG